VTSPISLTTFAGSMSPGVWREVAALFVECFTAAPYFEDPDELRTILGWGPLMLTADGLFVTARMDGRLIWFALAHGLVGDAPWQGILPQLNNHDQARAALGAPEDAFVVHELAVQESERGRGIARACPRELLRDRPETQTFIGAYERATEVRAMYRR
jgi:GNAT superfamily N-acetyltransferase